jgi:hypothetical protein
MRSNTPRCCARFNWSRYTKARSALLNSKRISQTEPPHLGSLEPCAQLPRLNLACNTDRADRYTADRAGRHMESII